MGFNYREDIDCYVYIPPLTGLDLKHNYFKVRDECADSLIRLQSLEIQKHNRFGWAELITVADTIGLPIKTTCQFLEKWGKVRDGTWEVKEIQGFTSKSIREQVEAKNKI
jgi:hypothetical protein